MSDDREKLTYCSFCGRHNHEVSYIVTGPGVAICLECANVAIEMVATARGDWSAITFKECQTERP